MDKVTLLILAAGLGSRFNGAKQIEKISGTSSLMEFALYDALEIGIKKFVMIVNKQFPIKTKEHLQTVLFKRGAQIKFVEQKLELQTSDQLNPMITKRTKPLGTGHAVLCAKNYIQGSFVTINADDYYGKSIFDLTHLLLKEDDMASKQFGLVGFQLKNTLTNHGSVSRGVCTVQKTLLQSVEEFTGVQTENGNIVGFGLDQQKVNLNPDCLVSMNVWVLNDSFFKIAERQFSQFLQSTPNQIVDEFYLPSIINQAIQENEIKVKVKKSADKWFGITYREDGDYVKKQLAELKTNAVYPQDLWKEKK